MMVILKQARQQQPAAPSTRSQRTASRPRRTPRASYHVTRPKTHDSSLSISGGVSNTTIAPSLRGTYTLLVGGRVRQVLSVVFVVLVYLSACEINRLIVGLIGLHTYTPIGFEPKPTCQMRKESRRTKGIKNLLPHILYGNTDPWYILATSTTIKTF